MTDVRLHGAGVSTVSALQAALGLRVSAHADVAWTTAAYVARRIVAIHAPCGRRDLIAKASRALAGALPEKPAAMLHEVIDDLIAGGDLTEQVALRLGEEEAPVLLFLVPPGFSRTPQRVYLHGVAPDDAPCIPRSVSDSIVCAGSQRFLECDDVEATTELLAKLGLVEHSLENRLAIARGRGPQEIVTLYRSCLERGARLEPTASIQWLGLASGLSYRKRWSVERQSSGLQIARVPQFYGADAWLLVDHDAAQLSVQLPVRGLPDERGCDAAWRLQLALDALAGVPARFDVLLEDSLAQLRVGFPLPQGERRKLLYLGGTRPSTSRPYDFCLPHDVLPAAQAVLEQIGFERSPTELPQ